MKPAYRGRPPGVVVAVLTLEREAYALLQELAPTKKSYGATIAGLIHAEFARREERRRLRECLAQEARGEESPAATVGGGSGQ